MNRMCVTRRSVGSRRDRGATQIANRHAAGTSRRGQDSGERVGKESRTAAPDQKTLGQIRCLRSRPPESTRVREHPATTLARG